MNSLDKQIFNLILNKKDPSKAYLCESKLLNETYECLMESVINWMYIQIQLIKDMINNPEIDAWGHGFDTESSSWSNFDFKKKATILMGDMDKSGTLAKLRDYINTTDKVVRIGTNEYDAKEIQMEFKPNSPEFLSEFRKSKLYQDLMNICMSGLVINK